MQREKFATQADPAVLAAIREIARQQGRQLQAVVEDAMRAYVENARNAKVNPQVAAIAGRLLGERASLYQRLAQ